MTMKSHTEYLWFNTKKHREFINMTPKAEEILDKSGNEEPRGKTTGYQKRLS